MLSLPKSDKKMDKKRSVANMRLKNKANPRYPYGKKPIFCRNIFFFDQITIWHGNCNDKEQKLKKGDTLENNLQRQENKL